MAFRFSILAFIMAAILGVSIYYKKEIDNLASQEKKEVLKYVPNQAVFKDLSSNEKISLKDYIANSSQELFLVHFWGTWCAPCEAEFPELLRMRQQLIKQNIKLDLITIAVDDDERKIKKFFSRFGDNVQGLVSFLDNDKIYRQYFGTVRVPETFLFDKNLRNRKKFSGAQDWSQAQFINYFRNLDNFAK